LLVHEALAKLAEVDSEAAVRDSPLSRQFSR
jgi:hypothetical protein